MTFQCYWKIYIDYAVVVDVNCGQSFLHPCDSVGVQVKQLFLVVVFRIRKPHNRLFVHSTIHVTVFCVSDVFQLRVCTQLYMCSAS
jgi:hypothetical protein